METILEQQRRYHEERERLVDAMTKEMLYQPKTHREKLNSDHRLKAMTDRSIESTENLKELYEDKDGLRKQDIQALSGPNEFSEFYDRLRQIRDFHRRHPGEISVPMSVEFERYNELRENAEEAAAPIVEFSDEEGYGRYLDLHESYEKYVNLKGVEKVDYITYLTSFDQLFDIPRERKNAAYREYLENLLEYLENYIVRVMPLHDIQGDMETVRESFEKQWSEGTFPGWGKETSSALAHSGAHLDLSTFYSWEELASLGLDRLKSALLALGLKCGGTLEQRAQRLWATKGRQMEHLDPSLFAKAKPGKAGKSKDTERWREVSHLEAQVYRLVELVSEQRLATREQVQRKQARVADERDASDDEDGGVGGAGDEGDSDDDDDDIPYNPKNLPLGWDGKPIPYWLYKLHGLNLYYTCEICGNHTYRGPKAFQRHFAEWRHAHGMRCLGIPNTAHFANVTNIEEAIALWQKIRASKESDRWQADVEEEFEDSAGNVVSRKTYEDLKRQGLL